MRSEVNFLIKYHQMRIIVIKSNQVFARYQTPPFYVPQHFIRKVDLLCSRGR